MNAPRRNPARDTHTTEIAARLYPYSGLDSLAPILKYEKDMVLLRKLIYEQRRAAIAKAIDHNARHNWIKRIATQGPLDEVKDPLPQVGAPSLPMPVEVSYKDSLPPFFAHLRGNGTHMPVSSSDGFTIGAEPFHDVDLIKFEKGVPYADGRIDLCKMVTGPCNIGDLMSSLRTSTFSRHFLLGNNIIRPTGAKAIAAFIDDFPDRFETWYLAGNCLDTDNFGLLVDSMNKPEAINNVWVKRNPLGGAAATDVFRLLTQTPNLRTLDLDQSELGDTGATELFDLLTKYSAPIALRHIYLNATGIGKDTCKQIAHYLGSAHYALHSIYMSNNPIGSNVATLAMSLRINTSFKRFSIQSCGLAENDNHCPTIHWAQKALIFESSPVESSPSLRYLNFGYVPLSQPAVNSILSAASASSSLLWFQAKTLLNGSQSSEDKRESQRGAQLNKFVRERLHAKVKVEYNGINYEQFEAERKRFLVSLHDVRFIDSVYRNRDAGAARRGLKRLDMWWKEEDVTLQQVQDGLVV